MKAKHETPLVISSFQLLDACEKSFLKDARSDLELSPFEFELKRITNFYTDASVCQIYWKNPETKKSGLLASIDIRETSQKTAENIAIAFQATLRNNASCKTFLCLVRDSHDVPFEAEKLALQTKMFIIKALAGSSQDIQIKTSPEAILEKIAELEKRKQEFKQTQVQKSQSRKKEESYVPKTKAENIARDLLGEKSSNQPINMDPNELMKDLMGQKSTPNKESANKKAIEQKEEESTSNQETDPSQENEASQEPKS